MTSLIISTASGFTILSVLSGSPDTPQNLGLNIASYVSIIVALIALVGTFVSRKVKSPADELARADFAYKKISERLDEVNKDRLYLQSVVDTLRAQLTKFDEDASISMEDKRKLRKLVLDGETRKNELIEENQVLNDRLKAIAEKVRLGQPITLSDVYGPDAETHTPSIDEIELTMSPKDHQDLQAARQKAKETNKK